MDLLPDKVERTLEEVNRTAQQAQLALASVQEVIATNAPAFERFLADLSAAAADLRVVAARLKGPQ